MRFPHIFSLFVICALILVVRASDLTTLAAPTVPQAQTTRISVAADGTEADGASYTPSFSGAGTVIAFISDATNLTAAPTNGVRQVFVKDLASGVVTLASVSTTGVPADDHSSDPVMASGGRYVAFESFATTLITGTANVWADVFVHDTEMLTTTLVSVAADGSPGNAASENPALSADGRYVVFQSSATNLVTGDFSPYISVFVHDRDTDEDGFFDEPGAVQTLRVSQNADATPANDASTDPSISANGRWIVFTSSADNLVANDSNNASDIFMFDRDADADGVFDEPGEVSVILISPGAGGVPANGFSLNPAISPDGTQVAFESLATNLVVGGTTEFLKHVFVRDWQAGITTLVSQSTDGAEADDWSQNPALSEHGRWIVFESQAENLIPADTNFGQDIFVRDRDVDDDGVFDEAGQVATARASVASDGGQMDGGQANYGTISWDGNRIAFDSDANNLVTGDGNFQSDVFLFEQSVTNTGADLTLAHLGPRAVLGTGSVISFSLQNLGPDLASDVQVQATITGENLFFSNWSSTSQGICDPVTYRCFFGNVTSGDTVNFSLFAVVFENPLEVFQGSVTVELEATSLTGDPIPENNDASYTTNYYACQADNGCLLDDIVCYLFINPSRTALESLGEFIPNLALYYHVRDQIMTSPMGHVYTDLYYAHSDEISTLVFANDNLWNLALDGLFQWEANFTALVDGEGDTAVITASQIQAVEDFLDALSAAGSPALQQAIAEERAKLPPIDSFIGMTMAEARGEVIGHAVYLPLITR